MSDYEVKDAEKDAIGGVSTRVDPVDIDGAAEKHRVHLKDVDEVAQLVAGFDRPVTMEENKRVLRKIDVRILPLMMLLYFMQFADKNTLNGANVMGLKDDTNMSQSQYNWLTTIFYIAYLAFEWPQTLGLQKFPVSKWMAGNIVIWGIAITCIAACKSWAGIFVCRLIMGACEGVMTSGFLILTSMFYTHDEATRRVGYWFLMNGSAQIFNALASFGILHVKSMDPWRVYFILCGLMTVVIGIAWAFIIPDGPLKSGFLTLEEKVIAVQRLKGKSGGIENKTFKMEQCIEALTDWKCWALAIFSCLNNFGNSLMNMSGSIIKSFGFTTSQTLLLGCVPGVIEIFVIWAIVVIIKFTRERSMVAALFGIPALVGGVMVVALPWSNKGGLLAGMYMTGFMTPPFVVVLSWNSLCSAGHTKKTTANMMFLVGYCVGNLCSPQLWQSKFAPRYYVPWGVILACWCINPFILLAVRYFLKKENARRDALAADPNYVQERFYDDDGNEIDPTFLDITDKKNMAFRYPL